MFRAGPSITIPPMVSVFTKQVGWMDESIAGSPPASGTVLANWIMYHPIVLPAPCTVKRLWWSNGAAVAGNRDVGIYGDDDYQPGDLLISAGLTALSGTNSVQFVDVGDQRLGPGLYWLATVSSDGSATIFRATVLGAYNATFSMSQSSSSLPSSATPIESQIGNAYLFGFSTVASP